jgi:hypothetical protein
MSIQIITGFTVNNSTPLDNRIVASGAAARNSIPYKYTGLRVFDTSDNRSYYYNGATFSPEITDQVNGAAGYVPVFTSQNYIGNSGVFQVSTGTEKRIGVGTNNPLGTNTYMQFGGISTGEDPNYFSGQSLPLTIHKGVTTVIGSNWYYTGFVGGNGYFNSSKGSSLISFGNDQGDFSISNRPGGPTAPVQTVYFSNNNKVGIGSNWNSTVLPAEALDVTGRIKVSNGITSPTTVTLLVGSTTRMTITGTDINYFSPNNTKKVSWVLYDTGYFQLNSQNSPSNTYSNSTFDINGFNNVNVNGTFSSSYMIISNNVSGPNRGLMLNDVGTGANEGLFIDWKSASNGSFAGIVGISAASGAGGDLGFFTTNVNTGTNGSISTRSRRMTITSTGNVGIGITSPTSPLSVNGEISATQIYSNKNIRAHSNSNIVENFFQIYISVNGLTSYPSLTFDTFTTGSLSNSIFYVECEFFTRMATTTMVPTQYYSFNSFRALYKTTSGVVSLLASEDIAGNTPVPMSPLNNNTMGGVTISPGTIDLGTPGALTFKQSISNNTATPLILTATCKYKITVVN